MSDSARIVSLKIVYFGAAGVGKTTNLERLRSRTTSESRSSDLIALDHEGDKTLMFDWTPVHAGKGSGYDVRLQVYAVPGKPKQESTKRRLLRDADGIVFILDSGPDKLGDNRAAWIELSDHLQALGLSRDRVPLVIQLNKRDLPNAMHGDDLRARLGMGGYPIVEAVAKGSAGVGATLLDITRRAVRTLNDPARAGGGEPLASSEISRIESSALPEAFAACGLLARRPKHTPGPGPVAAEEVSAASSHRSHDSPRALDARKDSRPFGEARIADAPATPMPSASMAMKENPTQRLMPAALVALPRIESAANFTPAPMADRPERTGVHVTQPSPGNDTPEEAMGLPLIDAKGPTPSAPGASQSQPRVRQEPQRDAMEKTLTSADARRVDRDRTTLPPPEGEEEGATAPGAAPAAGGADADLRKIVAESEARVMERISNVEEQIADLRNLLLHVSEQVHRVSTAPPESEARITKLVRDALGQMELSATLRAK